MTSREVDAGPRIVLLHDGARDKVAQGDVMRRTITDVPADRVEFERSILEADGFTVAEQPQANGLMTLVGTKPDPDAQAIAGSRPG